MKFCYKQIEVYNGPLIIVQLSVQPIDLPFLLTYIVVTVYDDEYEYDF